ncbi:MAG: hypothetical protein ACKO9Q_09185, partial [Pirellula sp.]
MSNIENVEQLEAIYGFPGETSTVKVTSCLTCSGAARPLLQVRGSRLQWPSRLLSLVEWCMARGLSPILLVESGKSKTQGHVP